MKTPTDPRVDEYIDNAGEFARPILRKLRALVHAGCPEAEETLKWHLPFFVTNKKILCFMAAFKAHCRFGFWHPGMKAVLKKEGLDAQTALTSFGCIKTPKELPDDKTMLRYIREATKLNEAGGAARARPAKKSTTPPAIPTPKDLAVALKKNKAAAAVFAKHPPSHKREYIKWIIEAKKPETRARRVAKAVKQLSAGKSLNWKYEK
jgi:uncharacterized protein YdeI (YjbR/CyaY-like superfamily)